MMASAVTKESFDTQVLHSDKPVLVDFWAPWCGPCRMVSPIVDQIGEENASRMNVYKINVDEQQELAAQYDIRSIPSLILFKDGAPVQHVLGAMPKQAIMSKVEPFLDVKTTQVTYKF